MSLSLQSWDSESSLLFHLSGCPASVLIGRDVEAPRGFYSCSFKRASSSVELGIIVNQQDWGPRSAIRSAQLSGYLIGHGRRRK
jgi:hypothetical protein